jgi:hypothetical protein
MRSTHYRRNISDEELEHLKQQVHLGDPEAMKDLFEVAPTVEHALILFNFYHRERLLAGDPTIDLADPYMRLLWASHEYSVLRHLCYGGLKWAVIHGFSLIDPKFIFPNLIDEKNNSIEIIRKFPYRKSDDDLEKINLGNLYQAKKVAEELLADISTFEGLPPGNVVKALNDFLVKFTNRQSEFKKQVDEIKKDRAKLREEFGLYLELLNELGNPLDAGVVWYKVKCQKYEKENKKQEVLDPDDKVVYFHHPNADSGLYAEDCFFPFYEYLTDEFCDASYPGINFLAAIEIEDVEGSRALGWFGNEWEDDIKTEEAENYAQKLGISYEDLMEGDDYYDEFRDFEREFEETLLPQRKNEKIQEAIEETVDSIINEYIEADPVLSVKEAWEGFSQGYIEGHEFEFDSLDWLDSEEISEVSEVLDEDFEHWIRTKTGGLEPRVLPTSVQADDYFRARRHIPDKHTNWWKFSTRPVCQNPPMIKLDTRAIGWKAAFGIEPLTIEVVRDNPSPDETIYEAIELIKSGVYSKERFLSELRNITLPMTPFRRTTRTDQIRISLKEQINSYLYSVFSQEWENLRPTDFIKVRFRKGRARRIVPPAQAVQDTVFLSSLSRSEADEIPLFALEKMLDIVHKMLGGKIVNCFLSSVTRYRGHSALYVEIQIQYPQH